MSLNTKEFVVRWLPAVAWTLGLCYLMLSPGKATLADDVSQAFGGTELSDAAGHTFLAFIETMLVFNALYTPLPERRALAFAAAFTVALGALFEAAQVWIPYRGATLLDFGAHSLGVVLWMILWQGIRALRQP